MCEVYHVWVVPESFTKLSSDDASLLVENVLETNGKSFDGRVTYYTFLEIVKQLTAKRDPVDHLMKAFNLFAAGPEQIMKNLE